MKSRSQKFVSATLVAGFALFAFNAHADSLTSKFAETLVTLRDSVDRLSKTLEDKKAEQRAEVRALNAQKSDLEIQVQREEAQVKALRAAIERRQSEVDTATNQAETLSPVLLQSIAQVRKSVDAGLPFKKGERLEELATIERGLIQKSIPQTRAVGRLWQFVEDEIRLTKENGLYKQPITLDGEEVLAEVARIGMVAMYFRTDDGTVGHVVSGDDGWTYRSVSSEKEAAQISYLFEAFRKQIRAGGFELPGAWKAGGAP